MRNIGWLAVAALVAACDDSAPAGPTGEDTAALTVDASQGWAYVAFDGGEAVEVAVTDPSTSADWDIAFNATGVMLNGGAAGPGEVRGYCICQNEDASDAAVMAMTPSSELADFEVVTTSVPRDDEGWTTDALTLAIDEWYEYNPITHFVTEAPHNVYAVRTSSGDAFAKLAVIDLSGSTQAHAGLVTIEYAFQPEAGAAFEPTRNVVLNAAAGERVLFETGTVATTGDWDLQLDGWEMRLNGGVSGVGAAGAYLTGESFTAVTDASAAPAGAYAMDAFGGVFDAAPWYRYNLDGNHQIWPTYEVYLVDTGDEVYKVQLTGYYSTTGAPRHITFRYELLD
jgi:hypothetical protein